MRLFLKIFLVLLICLPGLSAQATERKFFSNIEGKWSGPGEIVAGKYKGTKFVCTFDGKTIGNSSGMDIDGSCRVGLFAQKMNANVRRTGGNFKGAFLDGAKGEGMDVTGGRYTRSKLAVNIIRKDLRGVMTTSLSRDDKLNITIAVHVGSKLVPVIGMTLGRLTPKKVASN